VKQLLPAMGFQVKLSRPLDFLVVSDHAENLGLAPAIAESDPVLLKNEWGKAIHDAVMKENDPEKAFDYDGSSKRMQGEDKLAGSGMAETWWKRSNAISDKYNDPGLFTAIIGFEWTSMPDGNNLHRNLLFRDNAEKTSQVVPISSYDTQDPEQLWEYMDKL
jgi:hypothetical protein